MQHNLNYRLVIDLSLIATKHLSAKIHYHVLIFLFNCSLDDRETTHVLYPTHHG